MTSGSEKTPEDFARLFAIREDQDMEKVSAAASNGAQNDSSAIDATCMYHASEANKKQRDVAFAMSVLESESLTGVSGS